MGHHATHQQQTSLHDLLRCQGGDVNVERDYDPDGTPGYPGEGRKDAEEYTLAVSEELSDLQERLYASGLTDAEHALSVLVVLQGLDTAGKGGVIRHALGTMDPQGIHVHAFKAPTQEEKQHDFLWRVERELPRPGQIAIFDRSHYEDVLIQRVEQMAAPEEIERRYDAINQFEAATAARGTRIIKCFLHVSRAEQKSRLMARLENKEKFYKFNPDDVDTAQRWDQYMEAYSLALTRCNTPVAPWYVIPSDHKWYRNWAVATLLTEELRSLSLTWPEPDFDLAAQKARVQAL
ncbi:MAG: PPK2 family polyphosphate kinase [Actinomycetaceae bacterium]|nr:polyphosphate kinase 2 family protein [Actinomycetaceae bacterium]MDY6082299.1 PPK2 family polyphosphate kinase [Actinomycetaceae bacterium]